MERWTEVRNDLAELVLQANTLTETNVKADPLDGLTLEGLEEITQHTGVSKVVRAKLTSWLAHNLPGYGEPELRQESCKHFAFLVLHGASNR